MERRIKIDEMTGSACGVVYAYGLPEGSDFPQWLDDNGWEPCGWLRYWTYKIFKV